MFRVCLNENNPVNEPRCLLCSSLVWMRSCSRKIGVSSSLTKAHDEETMNSGPLWSFQFSPSPAFHFNHCSLYLFVHDCWWNPNLVLRQPRPAGLLACYLAPLCRERATVPVLCGWVNTQGFLRRKPCWVEHKSSALWLWTNRTGAWAEVSKDSSAPTVPVPKHKCFCCVCLSTMKLLLGCVSVSVSADALLVYRLM